MHIWVILRGMREALWVWYPTLAKYSRLVTGAPKPVNPISDAYFALLQGGGAKRLGCATFAIRAMTLCWYLSFWTVLKGSGAVPNITGVSPARRAFQSLLITFLSSLICFFSVISQGLRKVLKV
ncbi:hypothetical protein V8F20_008860 [Naviculisporaceae sp. PSN 640]